MRFAPRSNVLIPSVYRGESESMHVMYQNPPEGEISHPLHDRDAIVIQLIQNKSNNNKFAISHLPRDAKSGSATHSRLHTTYDKGLGMTQCCDSEGRGVHES